MGRYRVRDGVRVVVNGTAYSNGAEFDADPDDSRVRHAVRYGWAVPVDGGVEDQQPVESVPARPKRTRKKTP